MSPFSPGSATLTTGNEPQRILRYRVSAGFLSFIGVRPASGRDFAPADDRPGAAPVAIVSHGMWKRRFGASPALIGQSILLDRTSYTVVGIAPPNFQFYGREIDVFVPIAASTARVRGMPQVGVYARLKRGASVAAAQTDIDGLCRRWVGNTRYPKDWGARVWQLREYQVREVHSSLIVLIIAVALVLLIACGRFATLAPIRIGPNAVDRAAGAANILATAPSPEPSFLDRGSWHPF